MLFLAFSFTRFTCLSQNSFKSSSIKADPVPVVSTLSVKNTTGQRYGHLLLYADDYKDRNYIEVSRHLIQTDSTAWESGNEGWQDAMYRRRGTMPDALNNSYKESIKHYDTAVKFCTITKDSLCIGESLEQISYIYCLLKKYDSAHSYFNKALPILTRLADKKQLATTYNNYSNLLASEGCLYEAKQYIDSAISIAKSNNDAYQEMMYMNNLGSLYAEMGKYDKAIKIYQNCLQVNKQNKWIDRLVRNYTGLLKAFQKKGDYRSAFEYIKAFYLLRDSLNEMEVQLKIAGLNAKFEARAKELALKKNQLELVKTKQTLVKRNFSIFVISLLVLIAGFPWRYLVRKKQRELKQNQQKPAEVTKIFLEKNTVPATLEKQLINCPEMKNYPDMAVDFESNLYNQRILTDADWSTFKMHFEKAYPGYLLRLRTVYANLSEAEERLFLFIKLNLKSKESAAILGISVDSIKKTRTRLRKRINLREEEHLDSFIHSF